MGFDLGIQKANASAQAMATAQTNQAERIPATIYANIGYWDVINGEDVFISLPIGLGVDTMRPAKITGRNEGYRELVRRKNRLLELLLGAAEQLEPGEEQVIAELQVQVRKIPADDSTEHPVEETTLPKLTFSKRS